MAEVSASSRTAFVPTARAPDDCRCTRLRSPGNPIDALDVMLIATIESVGHATAMFLTCIREDAHFDVALIRPRVPPRRHDVALASAKD
jgi:hypothetical protein